MKPLTEYPTPETDEISVGYREMAGNGQFRYGPMDFARKSRDLERRLAACREALGEITGEFEAILKTKNAYTGGINILSRARETLTLTTPKQ